MFCLQALIRDEFEKTKVTLAESSRRKLEAAVSMDATDQPAMRLSDVDNDSAPVELGADLATDPIDIVPANGVYAFTADDIDGTSVDLSVLTGKPTLMVNVASE